MNRFLNKYGIWLLYAIVFTVLSELFVKIDLFDSLYEYTRNYESLELDEYLSVFPAILIILVIHTLWNQKKIRSLYQIEQEQRNQLKVQQKKLEHINEHLLWQVEEKLQEIRKKDQILIQQSRFTALGEMLSMIAHQWRQPLNVINITTFKIRESVGKDASTEKALIQQCNTIEHTVLELSKTIDDFRTFFKQDEEPEKFLLHSCIERASFIINAQLQEHSIVLEHDIDSSLMLFGIRSEMDQVIFTLLNNAYEALEKQENTEKKITLKLLSTDTTAKLYISDTGNGIPEKIIEKIFDPYFTTKHPSKGVGIGLYMVKIIIEQHFNGTVTVYNTDKGAEFIITLPLTEK